LVGGSALANMADSTGTGLPIQNEKHDSEHESSRKKIVYIWDMDETLILLKSLLNGTYAEAFNGLKDVQRGIDIGKMWEKYILDVCDNYFFYEQVSFLVYCCHIIAFLMLFRFDLCRFVSDFLNYVCFLSVSTVSEQKFLGDLSYPNIAICLQIENYNQPIAHALSQYDDGCDLSHYDFSQDSISAPNDDLNKRKLAYRHRIIAHKYKQVVTINAL